MKNLYLIKILIIVALIATAYAGANIQHFIANATGNNVDLEWQVLDESNIQYFVLQRKTSQTEFVTLPNKIYPNGSLQYKYIDQSIYKTNDEFLTYQIGTVYFNNPNIDWQATATARVSISGIRRTWGSIKAMFR